MAIPDGGMNNQLKRWLAQNAAKTLRNKQRTARHPRHIVKADKPARYLYLFMIGQERRVTVDEIRSAKATGPWVEAWFHYANLYSSYSGAKGTSIRVRMYTTTTSAGETFAFILNHMTQDSTGAFTEQAGVSYYIASKDIDKDEYETIVLESHTFFGVDIGEFFYLRVSNSPNSDQQGVELGSTDCSAFATFTGPMGTGNINITAPAGTDVGGWPSVTEWGIPYIPRYDGPMYVIDWDSTIHGKGNLSSPTWNMFAGASTSTSGFKVLRLAHVGTYRITWEFTGVIDVPTNYATSTSLTIGGTGYTYRTGTNPYIPTVFMPTSGVQFNGFPAVETKGSISNWSQIQCPIQSFPPNVFYKSSETYSTISIEFSATGVVTVGPRGTITNYNYTTGRIPNSPIYPVDVFVMMRNASVFSYIKNSRLTVSAALAFGGRIADRKTATSGGVDQLVGITSLATDWTGSQRRMYAGTSYVVLSGQDALMSTSGSATGDYGSFTLSGQSATGVTIT